MKKSSIRLKGGICNLYIGEKIFGQLRHLIKQNNLNRKIFVAVDKNVAAHYRGDIEKALGDSGPVHLHLVEPSEKNKSLDAVSGFYKSLLKNGFGRDSIIIAIGGGITGDVAGFVASSFARGVQLIHVPTSLLAMVDSSIGGKTGVNFGGVKNLIGSFYQPRFILIDTDFLKTLPPEEVICGVGEVLKYSLLEGEAFVNFLKSHTDDLLFLKPGVTRLIIERCVALKSAVVEVDETESTGLRKILNLGHTFAHAIEIERNHQIKHGQAVIIGLACALHLSNRLGYLKDSLLASYLSLIIKYAALIDPGRINIKKVYLLMWSDKKNRNGKIKFVLPAAAGRIIIDAEAGEEDVLFALKNGIGYFEG